MDVVYDVVVKQLKETIYRDTALVMWAATPGLPEKERRLRVEAELLDAGSVIVEGGVEGVEEEEKAVVDVECELLEGPEVEWLREEEPVSRVELASREELLWLLLELPCLSSL